MKLKRILAVLAALAMSASVISTVAFAESPYGDPSMTVDFEYPADPDGDGSAYLAVTVGYEGFENLVRSNNTGSSGAAITSISFELAYDTSKLSYEFGDNAGTILANSIGSTEPKWVFASALNRNTPYATSGDLAVFYFSLNDPIDFTQDSVAFSFATADATSPSCLNITVKQGSDKSEYKYGAAAESNQTLGFETSYVYGATTPQVEYVNVTTDGNVDGVQDGQVEKGSKATVSAKEVAGKTATLYANGTEIVSGDEYTFEDDVYFTVTYEDIVVPATYAYSIADSGYRPDAADTAKEDVYYKVNMSTIDDGAAMIFAKVANKKFGASLSSVPTIIGQADVDFTFVFAGVPTAVFGTDVEAQFMNLWIDDQEYEKK